MVKHIVNLLHWNDDLKQFYFIDKCTLQGLCDVLDLNSHLRQSALEIICAHVIYVWTFLLHFEKLKLTKPRLMIVFVVVFKILRGGRGYSSSVETWALSHSIWGSGLSCRTSGMKFFYCQAKCLQCCLFKCLSLKMLQPLWKLFYAENPFKI